MKPSLLRLSAKSPAVDKHSAELRSNRDVINGAASNHIDRNDSPGRGRGDVNRTCRSAHDDDERIREHKLDLDHNKQAVWEP